MEPWITLFSDLCVIVFDLLIYNRMISLRYDSAKSRAILYAGCGIIVAFYTLAVYVLKWPVSASAFLCMTLPSLLLFWVFSKHRDARFFLTFCFVDTVSLIVGFLARYIGILCGKGGNLAAILVMLLLFSVIYRAGRPYFQAYRDLLECISGAWRELTISAVLIYATMIFLAIYPEPLIERLEYGLPYVALSVMVLSVYVVFILNIVENKRLYEQKMQLDAQQKWFRLAYIDALTNIPNRMAYMEKLHELERAQGSLGPTAVMVFDLDDFKHINDTWGHSRGDDVLKRAAELLVRTFCGEQEAVYRIGGDEFVAISMGTEPEPLLAKLETLRGMHDGRPPFSLSLGYSFVDGTEENAVEQAFARAEAMMYASKRPTATL